MAHQRVRNQAPINRYAPVRLVNWPASLNENADVRTMNRFIRRAVEAYVAVRGDARLTTAEQHFLAGVLIGRCSVLIQLDPAGDGHSRVQKRVNSICRRLRVTAREDKQERNLENDPALANGAGADENDGAGSSDEEMEGN